MNTTGTALLYGAYLGYGTGNGIAIDASGDAYVTGTVAYSDFPTTANAYQTNYPGDLVVESNPAGSSEFIPPSSAVRAESSTLISFPSPSL